MSSGPLGDTYHVYGSGPETLMGVLPHVLTPVVLLDPLLFPRHSFSRGETRNEFLPEPRTRKDVVVQVTSHKSRVYVLRSVVFALLCPGVKRVLEMRTRPQYFPRISGPGWENKISSPLNSGTLTFTEGITV